MALIGYVRWVPTRETVASPRHRRPPSSGGVTPSDDSGGVKWLVPGGGGRGRTAKGVAVCLAVGSLSAVTSAAATAGTVAFGKSVVSGISLTVPPSSLQFAPDGQLYALQSDGFGMTYLHRAVGSYGDVAGRGLIDRDRDRRCVRRGSHGVLTPRSPRQAAPPVRPR